MRFSRIFHAQCATLFAAIILSACSDFSEIPLNGAAGYANFLPEPLNESWTRSAPQTMAADVTLFGGGISTNAKYEKEDETCIITITGGAPMMSGVSSTFSNPAVAGITGGLMDHVGDEPVFIKGDGEIQALASNTLIQVTGACSEESKLAYVAQTDVAGLRNVVTEAAEPEDQTERALATIESGPGRIEWDRTFGGPDSDWAYAMTGTRDGGLVTAGRTESKGAGREDVWIVRVDGSGTLVWDRTFGGGAIDRARAIVETRDGGLAIAGATESKGEGEYDAWVIKLDADGALMWDHTFGGDATDWASALVETRNGDLAVGAYTQATSDEEFDFWVLKLNSDGALLWDRTFGGAKIDWANAIAELQDGSLAVAGHTESKGAGGADMWLLKLDVQGNLLWDRTFGGVGRDFATAVGDTRDGGLIVAGPIESESTKVDIRVVKLNTQGDVVWDHTFGGGDDDWVRAVMETKDGGHAAAGYRMSDDGGLYDAWVLKLDRNGALLWDQTYGSAANEWARALIELPDGSLALGGDNWSKGAGKSDVWVIKLVPDAAVTKSQD